MKLEVVTGDVRLKRLIDLRTIYLLHQRILWWTDTPQLRVQNAVCEWWYGFQDEFLANERIVYYTSTSKGLMGSTAERQIDLFVKLDNERLSRKVLDWKEAEVTDEFNPYNNNSKATSLQIGRYGRDVFSSQPIRRYVPTFCHCGNRASAHCLSTGG